MLLDLLHTAWHDRAESELSLGPGKVMQTHTQVSLKLRRQHPEPLAPTHAKRATHWLNPTFWQEKDAS